jgi:hypothetical protein
VRETNSSTHYPISFTGNTKTIDEMENFKERLIEEKAQLSEKHEKLVAFIASESFKKIDPVQMTLLNIQEKAMQTYSQCLLERIVRC